MKRTSQTNQPNLLRLPKVISEISSFNARTNAELKAGIKKQARELAWFFSLFVCYVMFGAFVFFYIEECSDASMADDSSTPTFHDVMARPRVENVTSTCWLLYAESQKTLNTKKDNTTTIESTLNNNSSSLQANSSSQSNKTTIKDRNASWDTHFQWFLPKCKDIVASILEPITVREGHQRMCVVTEFQILKYAEYCIFTLLTVGYGNTVPVTIVGRYILILYAIIGVPIAVTMYSVAGKLLVQAFTICIRVAEMKCCKREPDPKTLRYKVLFVAIMFMILIMLIGCGVTSREDMENYDFHTSMYFWFVSLTTIGYGDISFDRNKHLSSPHFLLLSAGNLLFGLGIVAAIIESFALALEQNEIQMDVIYDENANHISNSKDERSSKTNVQKILGKMDFVQNSVIIGGMALDLARERPLHRLSRALYDGGFTFEDKGMYEIVVDFKDTASDSVSKRPYFQIRKKEKDEKDSISSNSGASYFQID